MKKLIALVLACLSLVCIFAGCGQKDSADTPSVYYLNFKPEQDAQWKALAKLYTERTGIPAHVVDDALSCTAYGAGRMLSRLDSMQDGMMNFYRKRQLKG